MSDLAEAAGPPPRVLVNATTLVVGGGIQIGVGFVEHALGGRRRGPELLCLIPRPIHEALPGELRGDARIRVIGGSPARPIGGRRSRAEIRRLEREFAPDVVYSLGFPSYVRFDGPEIGRYTNPWEIFPTALAWATIPWRRRPALILKTRYRRAWCRHAAHYETQTPSARRAIARVLHIPEERVTVIPNAPHPRFLTAGETPVPGRRRILCLAAAHRHKNLTFVPSVAARLRDRGFGDARFVLTLPAAGGLFADVMKKAERLGVTGMIENAGPLSMNQCIEEYLHSDAVFLPTVLEIFSATYLEAMAMSRPIVTSDLDFARDVCGDAASYYDPSDASGAAEALAAVLTDVAVRDRLVAHGRRQLATFPSPQEKHRFVLDWLADTAAKVRAGEPLP